MKDLFENWQIFIRQEPEPGKTRLYHYTRAYAAKDKDRFVIDPAHFVTSRGSYSRNEWTRSRFPRSFFYSDPKQKESIVTGDLFYVDVPSETIYNLTRDSNGYVQKHSHPTYGLRNDIEWTKMLEDIASSYHGVSYTLGSGGIPVVAYFRPLEAKRVDR